MCKSCFPPLNRREFVVGGSLTVLLFATPLLRAIGSTQEGAEDAANRAKTPAAVVKVVFLYPLPKDCDQGKAEAPWQKHHWNPYPGNQYGHAKQRDTFTEKVRAMGERIGMQIDFAPKVLTTDVGVEQYIAEVSATPPDAMLVFCLSSASTGKAHGIAQEIDGSVIVYPPTGASHGPPPAELFKAKRVHFVYSVENWEEIERSLRAVHAKKMLARSRVLRVGNYGGIEKATYGLFATEVISIPAPEYNELFDSIKPDEASEAAAMQFKSDAVEAIEVTDHYFVEAFRAHRVVGTLLDRYSADGITIACLMLQHRKPCVSFSIRNANPTATCGCENDIRATMTLLLNRYLFGRAGFQHNSGYDLLRNQYFATHCICALKLNGLDAPPRKHKVRPFFHQLPKTPAPDVQWTPHTSVILAPLLPGPTIPYYTGNVVQSPKCPPTGRSATRVLVDFDVDDASKIWITHHSILSVGSRENARGHDFFAQLFS